MSRCIVSKLNFKRFANSLCQHVLPRKIIEQYVMELPVFSDKNLNSVPNKQHKKKALKPIRIHTLSATRRRQCTSNTPYQTIYTNTGVHSNTTNVNKILSEDHIIRIKKLENELVEARTKIRDLLAENRILNTIGKRHENALSLYEGKQAKLPQIIKSYEEDIRILQSQIRQIKTSYKEMENRYKSQSTKHLVLQKQHKHLLNLSKNKQLSMREKLSEQLEEAQNTIKEQNHKIQNFLKQLELQNKTHKHHMNLENTKVKELQLEVNRLNVENKDLRSHMEKLRTHYSVGQIFSRGITKDSISISSRTVKPIPITLGQGDTSSYKTETSQSKFISLGRESSHEEEYEDNCPNKNFLINSTEEIKSEIIKEPSTQIDSKPYSSNMSSNIPWLNHSLAKLTTGEKTEQSNLMQNDIKNQNNQINSRLIPEISMSRTQKDLLLANLEKVNEDENNYEMYYKSKILKQTSNKKYSSLEFDETSSESELYSTSD